MNTPLLILDTHYLCHRAFHAQGKLAWEGKPTGVIFGFLKTLSQLKDDFHTDQIAFCFEGKTLYRKIIYPQYKQRRSTNLEPEKEAVLTELRAQIQALKNDYLPRIGFRNIFCVDGYESDDLMAAMSTHPRNEVVLVTADSDLFQCLNSDVSIWSPQKNKLLTARWFLKEYGLLPRNWALVKAIAGCSSDNVPGIPGIGEITALKYMHGKLPAKSLAFRKIMSESGRAIVLANRKLVELPFKGCPIPKMGPDEISVGGWRGVCEELGFCSLAGRPPLAYRAR